MSGSYRAKGFIKLKNLLLMHRDDKPEDDLITVIDADIQTSKIQSVAHVIEKAVTLERILPESLKKEFQEKIAKQNRNISELVHHLIVIFTDGEMYMTMIGDPIVAYPLNQIEYDKIESERDRIVTLIEQAR